MCSLQKKQLRRLICPAGPPGRLRCCCWLFSLAMVLLEGDVVVGRSREVGTLLLRRARGHELVAAAAVAVAAAAQELDALGDDLHGLPLAGAVGRFPLAPVEPAVDADRAALREVLRATLGLVAEDRDVEVVGLVDPRARLVAPAVCRNSGSFVRLPTRTTRLMFAMSYSSSPGSSGRASPASSATLPASAGCSSGAASSSDLPRPQRPFRTG